MFYTSDGGGGGGGGGGVGIVSMCKCMSVHVLEGVRVGGVKVCVVTNSSVRKFSTFKNAVELHVLGCRLTYQGQTVTSAKAWFNVALRPQKP